MTATRAADLPTGSKVRSGSGDLVAVRLSRPGVWWVDGLGQFSDHEIDEWLAEGGHAKVLLVGNGADR
jgi:hypothetical protein